MPPEGKPIRRQWAPPSVLLKATSKLYVERAYITLGALGSITMAPT